MVSRRVALSMLAGAGTIAVAGCLGSSDEPDVPEPTSLGDSQSCDQCGMVIARQPGPAGQSYYLDDAPPGLEDRDDGHARFCSTWCLYRYTFDMEDQGFDASGSYSTDYSTFGYELNEDGETMVVEANLDAEAFEAVSELTFVVDSAVEGAMGSSLIGFSVEDDASEFADEHGGNMLGDSEISPELISDVGT